MKKLLVVCCKMFAFSKAYQKKSLYLTILGNNRCPFVAWKYDIQCCVHIYYSVVIRIAFVKVPLGKVAQSNGESFTRQPSYRFRLELLEQLI